MVIAEHSAEHQKDFLGLFGDCIVSKWTLIDFFGLVEDSVEFLRLALLCALIQGIVRMVQMLSAS